MRRDRGRNDKKDVDEDPKVGRNRKLALYMRYSASGTQLFVAVGLGALFGWWLDTKTGTSPLLLILGTFVGFGGGFYTLYMELFGRKR